MIAPPGGLDGGPVGRVLEALRTCGCNPRPSGSGWSARCPAHDDRKPSLSITAGDDGRALLSCHAGCDVRAVADALGLKLSDLMADDARDIRPPAPARRAPPVRTDTPHETFSTARQAVEALEHRLGGHSKMWIYRDAAGEPVGIVVRWDGPDGKVVRPVSRLADGSAWGIRAMPRPRPLLNLPELLAADPGVDVYVVEGEPSVDAMTQCGLLATTSPGGSKAARHADWAPLAGRHIVVLPDHDEPGEQYAADVVRLAQQAGARSVLVVRLADRWPEMPKGGDIVDVLTFLGGDGEAVLASIQTMLAKANPAPEFPVDGAPILRRLSDVAPEPVSWLWPGRIALGKLTLLAGDPGLGKSFLTLDVAARCSTGAGWPDRPGERFEPGGVVLLTAEDGLADTIRPRLDAAGADVRRIVAIEAVQMVGGNGRTGERGFDLGLDLPALEAAIRSVDPCRLVIVDPLTAYLGGVDSHKNADIRALLAPLARVAEAHRVALLVVSHLNKSAGGPAIYRAMGSLAFAAAARTVWAVVKDRDDARRRLVLPVKSNISGDVGGLAYSIMGQDRAAVVAWEPEPVHMTADEAMSERRVDADEPDGGAAWLRDFLADGPRAATDGWEAAAAEGFGKAAVRRAMKSLGVTPRKSGFDGGWMWALPAEESEESEESGGRDSSDSSDSSTSSAHLRDQTPPDPVADSAWWSIAERGDDA